MAKINKVRIGSPVSLPDMNSDTLLRTAKDAFAKDIEPPKDDTIDNLIKEKKKKTYLN